MLYYILSNCKLWVSAENHIQWTDKTFQMDLTGTFSAYADGYAWFGIELIYKTSCIQKEKDKVYFIKAALNKGYIRECLSSSVVHKKTG